MKNHKMGNTVIATLLGVVAAVLITLTIASVGTTVIHRGGAEQGSGLLISVIAWGLSAFVASMLAGVLVNNTGIVPSILAGLIYLLLLAGFNILVIEASFSKFLVGILVCSASVAAAIWMLRGRRTKRKRKYKYKTK